MPRNRTALAAPTQRQRQYSDEQHEILRGSVEYEYEVPAAYCLQPPMPPAIVFVLDGSRFAPGTLPGSAATRVGFVTFTRQLSFFDLPHPGRHPHT